MKLATISRVIARWLRLRHVAGSHDTYLLGGELGATALEAAAYVGLSRQHAVGREDLHAVDPDVPSANATNERASRPELRLVVSRP